MLNNNLTIINLALAAESTTFTYIPLENEEALSVSLRAFFNGWGEWPMKKQPNGTWSITVDLDQKSVSIFFINGKWPQDMSILSNYCNLNDY